MLFATGSPHPVPICQLPLPVLHGGGKKKKKKKKKNKFNFFFFLQFWGGRMKGAFDAA